MKHYRKALREMWFYPSESSLPWYRKLYRYPIGFGLCAWATFWLTVSLLPLYAIWLIALLITFSLEAAGDVLDLLAYDLYD